MTTQVPVSAPGGAVSVLVTPHRSLSRSGLVVYLVAQSVATLGYAGFAMWRGVVLAPVFAVLALIAVGYCLVRVWRASAVGQIITLTPSQLEIATTSASTPVLRLHPYWVRVRLEPGRWRGWPSRLLLVSHGREVEVGAFLNDAERCSLARRLTQLLGPMHDRGGHQNLDVGDSE